jgi:hypothetical protein
MIAPPFHQKGTRNRIKIAANMNPIRAKGSLFTSRILTANSNTINTDTHILKLGRMIECHIEV